MSGFVWCLVVSKIFDTQKGNIVFKGCFPAETVQGFNGFFAGRGELAFFFCNCSL